MLHLVTVTTFFPNSADPHRAVFVANLVRALRSTCKVSIVSPVVYAPPIRWIEKWRSLRKIAASEEFDGAEILHPRFVVIPKVMWFTGISYFFGIWSTISRIKGAMQNCVLHAHFAYPDGVGVAVAARFLRIPYVITVHGSDINVYSAYRTLWPQIQWALSNAKYVIVVSRDLERKLQIRSSGSLQHLHCIPCAGFDPTIFSPRDQALARAKLHQTIASRIVVFVGQLVAIKGIDFLIDAWNILLTDGRLSNVDRLVVIGEGDVGPKLESRTSNLNLGESIRFVGAMNQSGIAEWLAAADLLCLPSLNEGTPNVVIEAMASGRPVVATSVGGLPEVVDAGKNGILVQPSNAVELADALAIALGRKWDADSICASVAHRTWAAIAKENQRLLDDNFPE